VSRSRDIFAATDEEKRSTAHDGAISAAASRVAARAICTAENA